MWNIFSPTPYPCRDQIHDDIETDRAAFLRDTPFGAFTKSCDANFNIAINSKFKHQLFTRRIEQACTLLSLTYLGIQLRQNIALVVLSTIPACMLAHLAGKILGFFLYLFCALLSILSIPDPLGYYKLARESYPANVD